MEPQPQQLFDINVQSLMRGLVHELRNPLSAILTASSLLPGAPGLDEETAMLLEVVSKEAHRMNRILTEFSAFAKPPMARPQPLDLAAVARKVAWHETSESAIEVRDELPEQLWVFADEHATTQALEGIFENAREALPGGGHIRLKSATDEQKVRLCIEDSGGGLNPQALEGAFQPFYSSKPSSTGLGLSVARIMLRASGGDCRIENCEDDSGACVTVELPSSAPAQEPVSRQSAFSVPN